MRSPIQQDPRIKRRLSCDLFFNGGRHTGIALNVSRGGLFIQTSVAAKPGADVAIDLNDPSGESIKVDARVVWKRIAHSGLMGVARGGVGLRIKSASESYYDFLARNSDLGPDPIDAGDSEPALSDLSCFRVRVKLIGGVRSRSITIWADSEGGARREVLQQVGEDWTVIELKARDPR